MNPSAHPYGISELKHPAHSHPYTHFSRCHLMKMRKWGALYPANLPILSFVFSWDTLLTDLIFLEILPFIDGH